MKGDLPSEFDTLPIRALTAEIHEVTGVQATSTPLAIGFRIHEEKRNLGGGGLLARRGNQLRTSSTIPVGGRIASSLP